MGPGKAPERWNGVGDKSRPEPAVARSAGVLASLLVLASFCSGSSSGGDNFTPMGLYIQTEMCDATDVHVRNLEKKLLKENIVITGKCGRTGSTIPGTFFCTEGGEKLESVIKIEYVGSKPKSSVTNESQILSRCKSERVPKVRRSFGAEGFECLVMERIDGEPYSESITRVLGPSYEQVACRMMGTEMLPIEHRGLPEPDLTNAKICYALELHPYEFAERAGESGVMIEMAKSAAEELMEIVVELNRDGIIHNDIKTHNLMVRNGSLVLVDFGISHMFDDAENRKYPRADYRNWMYLGKAIFDIYTLGSTRQDALCVDDFPMLMECLEGPGCTAGAFLGMLESAPKISQVHGEVRMGDDLEEIRRMLGDRGGEELVLTSREKDMIFRFAEDYCVYNTRYKILVMLERSSIPDGGWR